MVEAKLLGLKSLMFVDWIVVVWWISCIAPTCQVNVQ